MKKKKYLKIREQQENGTRLYLELSEKKDEKDCYYIRLEKSK